MTKYIFFITVFTSCLPTLKNNSKIEISKHMQTQWNIPYFNPLKTSNIHLSFKDEAYFSRDIFSVSGNINDNNIWGYYNGNEFVFSTLNNKRERDSINKCFQHLGDIERFWIFDHLFKQEKNASIVPSKDCTPNPINRTFWLIKQNKEHVFPITQDFPRIKEISVIAENPATAIFHLKQYSSNYHKGLCAAGVDEYIITYQFKTKKANSICISNCLEDIAHEIDLSLPNSVLYDVKNYKKDSSFKINVNLLKCKIYYD